MDYTVHGILQARILEWVAFPFSRASSQPRDWTQVSRIAGGFLPAEPQGKPKNTGMGSLSLLQWIFPIQWLNRGLLHCRWILYQLSNQGSPRAMCTCSSQTQCIPLPLTVCWWKNKMMSKSHQTLQASQIVRCLPYSQSHKANKGTKSEKATSVFVAKSFPTLFATPWTAAHQVLVHSIF